MDHEAEAQRRLGPFRRERRDAEIRRCHADGIPVTVIAKAVGLSRQYIHDILNAEGKETGRLDSSTPKGLT